MKDPKCFTCEDNGYLVCGNCDKFEELVVVKREDLEFITTHFTPEMGDINKWMKEYYIREDHLRVALDKEKT